MDQVNQPHFTSLNETKVVDNRLPYFRLKSPPTLDMKGGQEIQTTPPVSSFTFKGSRFQISEKPVNTYYILSSNYNSVILCLNVETLETRQPRSQNRVSYQGLMLETN